MGIDKTINSAYRSDSLSIPDLVSERTQVRLQRFSASPLINSFINANSKKEHCQQVSKKKEKKTPLHVTAVSLLQLHTMMSLSLSH